MPKQYPQEAVELCRSLYVKYGGSSHDLVESEMQKAGYVGWKKKNLYDSGSGKNARHGWITKWGFEESHRLHLEKLTEKVNDDEQDLYIGIKTIRKRLQIEAMGKNADTAIRREYREYCKLEIEARRNLDLSRDNLETFVAGYEKLLMWISELDTETAKRVLKLGDRLIDMAQAHYGKNTESFDNGANDRTDEGGE